MRYFILLAEAGCRRIDFVPEGALSPRRCPIFCWGIFGSGRHLKDLIHHPPQFDVDELGQDAMLRRQAMPQLVVEDALDGNLLAAGIIAVGVPIGEAPNGVLSEAEGVRSAFPPF